MAGQDLPVEVGMIRGASGIDDTDCDSRAFGARGGPRLLVRHLVESPLLDSERIRTGKGCVNRARHLHRHNVPALCLLSRDLAEGDPGEDEDQLGLAMTSMNLGLLLYRSSGRAGPSSAAQAVVPIPIPRATHTGTAAALASDGSRGGTVARMTPGPSWEGLSCCWTRTSSW